MSVDRGRLKATWLLAESCLDHLPQARQASSTLAALPGLAPSRQVPCSMCAARGRVSAKGNPCASCPPRLGAKGHVLPLKPAHGCRMCPVCEGTGWRRRRKDDPEFDEYAGIEVPAQAKADDISVGAMREALAAQRERPEIAFAAESRAQAIVDAHERPESEQFGWERQWERMCAHGSYAELVVALELLRMREPERYQIVWQVVVQGHGYKPEERDEAGKVTRPASGMIRLSDGRQAALNESMIVLASLMPERIRVPFWLRERDRDRKKSLWHGRSPAHARERRERDAEVRRLRFEEGWKVTRLQRQYALSRTQVYAIIAKCEIPEREEESAA